MRPVIYWFRRDLRLTDLPGLAAACRDGAPLLPCFVLDEDPAQGRPPGAASRWWLHHSLQSLQASLEKRGLSLLILRGEPLQELPALAEATDAAAVYCSRDLEPSAASLENSLHDALQTQGVTLRRFPGSTLLQPEQVSTQDGGPYRVFTPFWRRCLPLLDTQPPLSAPTDVRAAKAPPGLALDDLALCPRNPDWAAHWGDIWQPGEAGALRRLDQFLQGAAEHYPERRDFPADSATSKLSPHLAFGEISPRQVLWQVRALQAERPQLDTALAKFLSELGWREFNHHLMHHYPNITSEPFQENFRAFPWREDTEALRRWQRGETGYPIVDAGMRELWQTGYMHNRLRMVVASFLCKHLLLPWQSGEAWFFDTLVDADVANNVGGWQWAAGSGADAAPYFRIFNPWLQGKKFDPDGTYIKRWIPELKDASPRDLHSAGRAHCDAYPAPMVDHTEARERALNAWEAVRAG